MTRYGAGEWRQLSGPLLATAAGGRLRQGHLWELVRRLARTAGVGAWEQLSPHSLRHSAITFAQTGAFLRDVQDYAGHKDPRTTPPDWLGIEANAVRMHLHRARARVCAPDGGCGRYGSLSCYSWSGRRPARCRGNDRSSYTRCGWLLWRGGCC